MPLTLDAALRLATIQNPALIAKRNELGIAEGELKQASILFQHNPELSLRVDRRRVPSSLEQETSLGRGIEVFPELGFSVGVERGSSLSGSQTITEFEIELSQEFEVFGQPRARRRAAEASREVVLADIAATEREILTLTRHQFYEAQVAWNSLNLASEQFGFSQSVLEMSRTQLEAGEISRTDYRQLEIQSADVHAESIIAKSELEVALNELKFTLGLIPSTELSIDVGLIPPQVSPMDPSLIVEKIVASHPDLLQARLLLTQREKEEVLVRKEAKPNITGSIFFANEDENEKLYGVGLSIPLGFFNRGQGAKAAARAFTRVAAAEESAARRSLRSRAHSAIIRLRSAREAVAYYYGEVLPAVKANLAQLENAFRQGEISMIELRVNQRDLLEAQSDALDRLGNYYYWLAEVEGMMGENLFDGRNQIQRESEASQ